jgi:uncharacterized membrane protein
MWSKIKGIYNYIFKVFLALSVILFMIFVFITLASKQLNHNAQVMTYISLVTVLLSIPSIVDSLAKEFNPKKKVYKLSCKCPNCRHLVQMDMKEE